ncbi:hypothetical protein SS50377_27332 [Spironucleus salmonicida]|uniref:Uncharacterized protein n=1 Tax=Spironucleus salmonicida TaxID=348837 RepID=V6LFU0_9EUKA|nr:hypothetical protein SS50377_27332 [Spironucleus salmonicida]|eukprot:EST43367.1 Hypothetical protein SS50377_17047 [Spironucleus salmonicida]
MKINYFHSQTHSTVTISTEDTYTYAILNKPVSNKSPFLTINSQSKAKSLICTILYKQIIHQRYPNQNFTLTIHDENSAHAMTAASLVFLISGVFMNFVSYGQGNVDFFKVLTLPQQTIKNIDGEQTVEISQKQMEIGRFGFCEDDEQFGIEIYDEILKSLQ